MLRQNGQTAQANQLEASLKGVDERIATYKDKAKKLINRSLEVMPADVVEHLGTAFFDHLRATFHVPAALQALDTDDGNGDDIG